MSKNTSYQQSKKVGNAGERLVLKVLNNCGYKTELVVDKTLQQYYDLISESLHCSEIKFTSEVKYDVYSGRSGNIAIEYYNSKLGKPSGISLTKSDLWFQLLSTCDIFVAKTQDLKDYVYKVKPKRDLSSVGDNNACIKLYDAKEILSDIFVNLRDLPREVIQGVINGKACL